MRMCILAVMASTALFGQDSAAPGQTATASPQTTGTRPEFEVASIKPSAPDEFDRSGAGMHLDGSQVSWHFLSLRNYIATAYRLKNYQISAPEWMASERFDIKAKLPAGAAPKDVSVMLQSLLEDRFQMKAHRESKELPVHALVVAKGGLKMPESPLDSGNDVQNGDGPVSVAATRGPEGITVNLGNGSYYVFGNNKFEGKKMSLLRTANVLSAFMDRPIVDMTNLKGDYDFVLELSTEDFRAMQIRVWAGDGASVPPHLLQLAESASGDSLQSALEKLGLKLESRKAPIEMLVIDHAEKTPTDN